MNWILSARESIGVKGKDKGRIVSLGILISTTFLIVNSISRLFFGGVFSGFSFSLVYGFIQQTMVGFGEETIWRGYIQTRLVAHSGTVKGLIVTSVLFAVLFHFPKSYYESSGVLLEALASASIRLFSGLLFGYTMLRSQNIVPSSIFHLFWNWSGLLWKSS